MAPLPPGTHAGVVVLRSDEEGLDDYLRLAGAAVERFELDEIAGAVVVVNNAAFGFAVPQVPDAN